MTDLSIVLVNQVTSPAPERVVAAAAKLGIVLEPTSREDLLSFDIRSDGRTGEIFIAMLMPAPHPDVAGFPEGPTSPSTAEAAAAPAHFICTAMGLEGTARERDTRMAALTAALIDSTDAVGAMLGHGVVVHKARLFSEMAALGVEEGVLPCEIAVDITVARESETTMSFLTHNMPRYGREDFYVTCPITGKGAIGYVLRLVRWMLTDLTKQLGTGETLGRTADERIVIRREPNPSGRGGTVIRLDLPG